eukprot:766058-Hanusia_phi.AAC.6
MSCWLLGVSCMKGVCSNRESSKESQRIARRADDGAASSSSVELRVFVPRRDEDLRLAPHKEGFGPKGVPGWGLARHHEPAEVWERECYQGNPGEATNISEYCRAAGGLEAKVELVVSEAEGRIQQEAVDFL